VVALAVPLVVDSAIYAMNLSLSTTEPVEQVADQFSACILGLVGEVQHELELRSPLTK